MAAPGAVTALTEFLDASILDERPPGPDREVTLNIYDPGNPNKPPIHGSSTCVATATTGEPQPPDHQAAR